MIAAVALLLLSANPSLPGASMVSEQLTHGLTGAKVGQWVTYRFDDGGDRVHFWRIAVVGEEKDALGRPALWLELDVGQHHEMKSPLSQMRLLVARSVGLGKGGVTRAFVSFGVQRPREVEPASLELIEPGEAPKAAAAEEPIDRRLATMTEGMPTRLITQAGTVTARPIEMKVRQTVVKRIWVSEQIPILQVAKVELLPISHSMEVRDYGADAKSLMPPPSPTAAKISLEPYTADPAVKEP